MAKTPLTVTVITDTHYYSKKTGTKGKAYDAANAKSQKLLKYSEELLRAAFKQIKEDKRTDIVLLSGDTTNNGEIEAHEEFIEMLRDLKKSGKRVYVLTATHDYQDDGLTDSFVGNEKVKIPAAKREQLYDMYKEFGPDEAIAVHRDSMSYVVQLADGYRLFALNDDRNLSGKSGFSDECFEWIKAQAEDARKNDQFILAMTHHPLIAPSPIYELIGKNDMLGDYETRRNELADLGIQFILTGHTHVHDIGRTDTHHCFGPGCKNGFNHHRPHNRNGGLRFGGQNPSGVSQISAYRYGKGYDKSRRNGYSDACRYGDGNEHKKKTHL